MCAFSGELVFEKTMFRQNFLFLTFSVKENHFQSHDGDLFWILLCPVSQKMWKRPTFGFGSDQHLRNVLRHNLVVIQLT